MKLNCCLVLLLGPRVALQLFEVVFELIDSLLAMLKVLNWLPSRFLRREALPQHLVLDYSFVVCSLDDTVHLPLLTLRAHLYVIVYEGISVKLL